jgi:hypothetical protein
MSPTLIAAALIVIIASAAFVAVGTAFRWNVTAPGYGLWTQVVGAVAVLGLAGVSAWSRIDSPLLAGLVMVAGVALAVIYVLVHRRLTRRVREILEPRDD